LVGGEVRPGGLTSVCVPGILIQRETQAVMTEMMPKAMAAQQGPNAPPGMDNFMTTFFRAIGIVSLIIALVWLVAKFVLYVLGIRYLRQPDVRELFAPYNSEIDHVR
jgi:hypothetical protein